MLAGLTFPIFLAIVPLFFVLRGIGLLNTLPGLIVTYAAFAFPFTVFFLYAFFRSLSKSIAEAAAVDGAGEWRTFFQIMLPMARPGLATVAILNFVGLWNQFLLPIALNTNPDNYVLTQAMASFASQAGYSVDFGALFAAVVITVVPVLIIYLIFQRQLQGRSREEPASSSPRPAVSRTPPAVTDPGGRRASSAVVRESYGRWTAAARRRGRKTDIQRLAIQTSDRLLGGGS